MLLTLSAHRRREPPGLVELLEACHQRIRHFIGLCREVARRGDVPGAEVARACADAARYFREALPLHVADEEESIFPRLLGSSAAVDDALATWRREHAQQEEQVVLLLRALEQVRRRPLDERSRGRLAAIALPLEAELEEHLLLEESTIFPVIRDFLSKEAQRSIVDELRARRSSSALAIVNTEAKP